MRCCNVSGSRTQHLRVTARFDGQSLTVTRNDLQDFYSLQRGYSLYGLTTMTIMTSIPGATKEEGFRVFFVTMQFSNSRVGQ
jgi:hypothetical protein